MSQQAQAPSLEVTNFQQQLEKEEEDEWDGDNWDDGDYDVWLHGEDNTTAGEIQSDRSTPWKYTDVTGKQELRLLVVEPGAFDDPIRCRLVHVRTDTRLEYEAISYTWADESGDATKSKTVSLAGTPFPVTANCEAVLRRVRKQWAPRIVWIDAVCINQENKDEQGHQVQLMPDIYSRAKRVLIYLGEPLDEEHEGLRWLEHIRLTDGRLPTEGDDYKSRIRVWGSISRAMRSLFGRRYFSRVWILQEVALAREGVVICGEYKASWEHFRDHDTLMTRSLVWEWQPFLLPRVVALAPRKFRDSSSLLDLLDNARDSHATDPRDKIFAVFGMIQCAPMLGLVPDYNSSIESVYTEAALNIAETHGPGNLLIRALGPRNHQTLPDWVPDWSVPSFPKLGKLTSLIGQSHGGFPVRTGSSVDRGQKCIEFDVVRVDALKSLMDGVLTHDFEVFLLNCDSFTLGAGYRELAESLDSLGILQELFCYSLVYSSSRSVTQSALMTDSGKRLLLLSSSETVFSFAGVCVVSQTEREGLDKVTFDIARGFGDSLRDILLLESIWQPDTAPNLLRFIEGQAQDTVQSMSIESISSAIDSLIKFMFKPREEVLDLHRRLLLLPTLEYLNEANIVQGGRLSQELVRQEVSGTDRMATLCADNLHSTFNTEETAFASVNISFVCEKFKEWVRKEDGERLAAILRGSGEATEEAWKLINKKLGSNQMLAPTKELLLSGTGSKLPITRARLEVGGA